MNKENNNIIFAIVLALFILLVFGGFWMMGFGGHSGMMNGFYGGFGFMWIFGWIMMVLVILWLTKQLGGKK